MVRNMLILMDGSADAEKLLDCSTKIFPGKEDHFKGAFVEGIIGKNLDQVFDFPSNLNTQFTRSEIIEKILHTNLNNSTDYISRFVNKCEELSLKTKVYITDEDVNEELVNESLFNDLFLIGKDLFNRPDIENQSFDALNFLLHNTKCPILLLSCEQVSFQNVVLIYDGSNRSFEAIKLFTYLMGEQLQVNKVTINIVVTEASSENEKAVIEYLKMYKQHFYVHRVYPDNYFDELRGLIRNMDSCLLVTGVNKNEILEDIIFNKSKSFFMHGQRSIFLG